MSDVQSTVQYRDIQGFPGYRVGDDGSVWSIRYTGSDGVTWMKRKIGTNQGGYSHVNLHQNGTRTTKRVAHLVLEAFVGPRPVGMEARHFPSDDKADNSLPNLSWSTKSINQRDRITHGTDCRGTKHKLAKLDDDKVREIKSKYIRRVYGIVKLAEEYGVDKALIQRILVGKSWPHIHVGS